MEVTQFDLKFQEIGESEIMWADAGEHPQGPNPVDLRLVKVYEKANHGQDWRLVKHMAHRRPLPSNFPNW
jgi:hypothetical protein